MRRAGRLAARALAHVEPHVVPGVDTGTLDDVVRAFWSRAARARDARLPRVQPLNVHLPERGGVPRCAQRARRAARGRHRQRGRRRGHERGMARGVSRTLAVGRRRGGGVPPRVGWWTRRGTRSDWGWRRVGRARGSVTCWSRSRGGCARRGTASSTGTPRTAWAGDSTSRRRFGTAPAREEARGWRLRPGHFFTIEPMATENGSVETATLRDGWTVVTADRVSRSAQFEHTVGVGAARVRDLHARRRSVTTKTRVRECISIDASIDASVIPLVRKQNQSLRNNTRVRAFVRGARLLSPPRAPPSRKTPSSVSRKQNAGSMETSSRERPLRDSRARFH